MVACLEHEDDNRRLMLRAAQLGVAGDEYVYILPDYVRDQNRSEMWLQYTAKGSQDIRDVEAKDAFKSVFFVSFAF